jgi:CHAT domain-containing protein
VGPLFTSKGSAIFVVPHGCTALTKDSILDLKTFTDADLRSLLMGAAEGPELGGWLGAYANQFSERQAWLAAIEDVGRALWDGLLGPVHERLRTLGLAEGTPVLLLPQGRLGLLPLHAAWREAEDGGRRYFLDDYTVIYAPSGYALATSQKRLEEPRRQQRALLAVTDPTGSLPCAQAEVSAMAALFPEPKPRLLPPDQTSPEAVFGAAPTANYLHFACHGSYDWQDPMQSSLNLTKGQHLTLSDAIARLDLSAARLIVLSACETGLTDIRQSPDEFLGLPAGFLQAGAPAVVSTLWQVDDLSTSLLMERFYRNHLHDGLAPAAALRTAQRWLRDTTAGELGLAERWEEIYQTTANPERRRKAFKRMRDFRHDPQKRSYAHPYHWAAFTLAGT